MEHTETAELIVKILKISLIVDRYQISQLSWELSLPILAALAPNARSLGSPHFQQTKE